MKIIRTFILSLVMVTISVAVGATVSIYGWGLHPKDWWWIIVPSVVGVFVNGLILAAMQSED